MRTDARNFTDQLESFEACTLGPGQKKFTVEYDQHDPKTATFTFNREDSTLGALLCSALLSNDHVLFCGSKTEHPLIYKFILRVTTDGTITPEEALVTCAKRLIEDLSALSLRVTREWEIAKMAGKKTPTYFGEDSGGSSRGRY